MFCGDSSKWSSFSVSYCLNDRETTALMMPVLRKESVLVRVKAREMVEPRETKLLGDLARSIAELPQVSGPKIKEFSADTAGAARGAATEWLSDFGAHGPLEIESIRTSLYNGKFVAVIAFYPA
jgi:hypothetical protein